MIFLFLSAVHFWIPFSHFEKRKPLCVFFSFSRTRSSIGAGGGISDIVPALFYFLDEWDWDKRSASGCGELVFGNAVRWRGARFSEGIVLENNDHEGRPQSSSWCLCPPFAFPKISAIFPRDSDYILISTRTTFFVASSEKFPKN